MSLIALGDGAGWGLSGLRELITECGYVRVVSQLGVVGLGATFPANDEVRLSGDDADAAMGAIAWLARAHDAVACGQRFKSSNGLDV